MYDNILKYTAFVTAIAIAAVAAYFSVIGLATIFSGAFLSVVIMAGILEVGKLVSAVWLHSYWKTIEKSIRIYLSLAVVILMFITSMGIFGYLSKAHIEQGVSANDTYAKIERFEQRISSEEKAISRANNQLSVLDSALDRYIELGAVSKGLDARKEQEQERVQLNALIEDSYQRIDNYNEEVSVLKTEIRAFEVEVGPLKYIAELIYGEDAKDYFDQAVRYAIMIIIFVFDPLAVILLIVSAKAIKNTPKKRNQRKERIKPIIDARDVMYIK